MVTLPSEGSWSLRSLGSAETARALAFLRRDPLLNIYFISRILDDGIGTQGQTLEIAYDGEPVCLASISSNVLIAPRPGLARHLLEGAASLIAERIVIRMVPVRAIIAEAEAVDALWERLRNRVQRPTVVRPSQPVYVLDSRAAALPELRNVRYAQVGDLDQLVPACAAMHREEVGIDPLDRDAAGYRQRIKELVQKKRSLVWFDGPEIIFKCEFSAVTPEGIQLMGVWTRPERRRQGVAREGMREVCGHILRQRKAVTLFVNDFNAPAIELYERLGFRRIGCNRALIW